VGHVPGSYKLALLDVDGAAGFSSSDQQVSLPTEESGDLQDVRSLGSDLAMGWLVDVGEDREAGIFGESAKYGDTFFEAGAAKALHAGAVGFVVAGFEDERDTKLGSNALEGFGHAPDVSFGLDDTRPGNEEELARTDVDRSDFKGVRHEDDSTSRPSRADDWGVADSILKCQFVARKP
jgi:hypothetical protein